MSAPMPTAVRRGVAQCLDGYDPIGTLRATEAVYRSSPAEVRPSWSWVLGSPIAWAAAATVIGPRRPRLVLLALTLQTLGTQLLLETVW